MIESYDVSAKGRPSDVILDSINGLNSRKNTGALNKNELSNIIIHIGDLFANKIKQGKVSEDEIEAFESHITQFTGENKDKYFSHSHSDLDRGAKSALESIDFAREELEKRNSYAQPVMDAESYERTFRKLG